VIECTQQDTLIDYLYGKCTPVERNKFEEHLLTCPTCADNLESTALLQGALDTWTPETLSQSTAYKSAPANEPAQLPSLIETRPQRWWQNTLQPSFALAATLVVVVGGIMWQGNTEESNQQTELSEPLISQDNLVAPTEPISVRPSGLRTSVPPQRLLSLSRRPTRTQRVRRALVEHIRNQPGRYAERQSASQRTH
jgi:hypothetical protein